MYSKTLAADGYSSPKRRKMMRSLKIMRLVLFLLFVIVFSASLATLMFTPETQAALRWAEVCCGSYCGGMDWCVGLGAYNCCIPEK